MSKLLTPQEVVQTLLDGGYIEFKFKKSPDEYWRDFDDSKYSVADLLDGEYVFRLAPERITIGDISFPKAVSEPLSDNTLFYVPDVSNNDLYMRLIWNNHSDCKRYLQLGLVHLSKENAIAHAIALVKLSGGNV